MARTRGMSIGAVTVSDKVSVGAPRYTIISIVSGHRVSVGVPRYTKCNRTEILDTVHEMSLICTPPISPSILNFNNNIVVIFQFILFF